MRELFLAKGRTRLVTRSGMDGEAWEGWAVSLDPKIEEGRGSAEAELLIACPYRAKDVERRTCRDSAQIFLSLRLSLAALHSEPAPPCGPPPSPIVVTRTRWARVHPTAAATSPTPAFLLPSFLALNGKVRALSPPPSHSSRPPLPLHPTPPATPLNAGSTSTSLNLYPSSVPLPSPLITCRAYSSGWRDGGPGGGSKSSWPKRFSRPSLPKRAFFFFFKVKSLTQPPRACIA